MAELLKGAPVARALTEELAARCAVLRERGVVPTLAIVRVGEREDDLSYERGALKRCEKVGIEARRILLPADVSQDELLTAIEDINADSAVHGCLMFRPLPAGLDENAVAAALDPAKDVDSMTPASLLTTLSGRGEGFAPCTAEAVLALLDHYGVELDGAKVAVVGRSLVIGRPVAAMLTARNATVTTCHTHTRDLAAECRSADIVVAAVGRARTIGADAVREGQTIIDVATEAFREHGFERTSMAEIRQRVGERCRIEVGGQQMEAAEQPADWREPFAMDHECNHGRQRQAGKRRCRRGNCRS